MAEPRPVAPEPGAPVDLLVVGAGPTGIAIGAEAARAGLDVVLVERGAVTANLLEFPTYMRFFTTRDRLEIAGLPFAVPDDKPDRRQALAYYRAVVAHHDLAIALHEEVQQVDRVEGGFEVRTMSANGPRRRPARAVALATGYFHRPRRLGVPGEELPLVHARYLEPYGHFGESVVVVGGGNSAVEAALELWRAGVEVTLVHRRAAVKPTVKYWVRPDFEHRVEEGSISAHYESVVTGFRDDGVELSGPAGTSFVVADAVYVLIGYEPDAELERRCGVEVDPETAVPRFDAESCESNVPGLYIAGTLQAGRDLGKIFIENSREHGVRIVEHLLQRLLADSGTG
jgi:thioredoxin reductase (NADPH)